MTLVGGYSQTFDTLSYDVGTDSGFQRIRELSAKGELRKVWTVDWSSDGSVTRSFSQYNSKNQRVTSIDSVFDKYGELTRLKRKIGGTIEGDDQEFEGRRLIRRSVSLYINGKYLIFQKYKNNGEWAYRSIVDGSPPDYIPINAARFDEAVEIYHDRLLIDKLSN